MSKKILIVFIFLNLITPSILATQIFENDSFQNNTNSMDSENQKIVNLINMINKSMVSNYLKELLNVCKIFEKLPNFFGNSS